MVLPEFSGEIFMEEMNHIISERILEELRKNPKGLTITDIASLIDINRNSTARYLDVLQITGRVEMRKVGPAKLYVLSQRVPLNAMLNLSEDGILTFDSELNVIRVNEAFSRIIPSNPEDILSNNLSKLNLPGLSKEDYIPLYRDALAGTQTKFETTLEGENGTRHLHIKLVPTTFDDGSTGATIIVDDITTRKLSEVEIQHQHDFLRLVMESVAHPFYVIDANDYTIKMANRAARLGSLSDESTCYTLTHGSNKPCSGSIHPCPLKQVVETRKPAIVEHVHHQVSGMTRHVEIHAHPILNDTGEVVQVIEYNMDVTDRKQVEADLRILLDMYQMIVENMEDGVFVIQDGRIVFCNPPLSRMLGYEVHEITGIDLWNLVSSDDWKKIANIVSKIENGKEQQTHHNFFMMSKRNKPVHVKTRIVPTTYAGDPATIFNIIEED